MWQCRKDVTLPGVIEAGGSADKMDMAILGATTVAVGDVRVPFKHFSADGHLLYGINNRQFPRPLRAAPLMFSHMRTFVDHERRMVFIISNTQLFFFKLPDHSGPHHTMFVPTVNEYPAIPDEEHDNIFFTRYAALDTDQQRLFVMVDHCAQETNELFTFSYGNKRRMMTNYRSAAMKSGPMVYFPKRDNHPLSNSLVVFHQRSIYVYNTSGSVRNMRAHTSKENRKLLSPFEEVQHVSYNRHSNLFMLSFKNYASDMVIITFVPQHGFLPVCQFLPFWGTPTSLTHASSPFDGSFQLLDNTTGTLRTLVLQTKNVPQLTALCLKSLLGHTNEDNLVDVITAIKFTGVEGARRLSQQCDTYHYWATHQEEPLPTSTTLTVMIDRLFAPPASLQPLDVENNDLRAPECNDHLVTPACFVPAPALTDDHEPPSVVATVASNSLGDHPLPAVAPLGLANNYDISLELPTTQADNASSDLLPIATPPLVTPEAEPTLNSSLADDANSLSAIPAEVVAISNTHVEDDTLDIDNTVETANDDTTMGPTDDNVTTEMVITHEIISDIIDSIRRAPSPSLYDDEDPNYAVFGSDSDAELVIFDDAEERPILSFPRVSYRPAPTTAEQVHPAEVPQKVPALLEQPHPVEVPQKVSAIIQPTEDVLPPTPLLTDDDISDISPHDDENADASSHDDEELLRLTPDDVESNALSQNDDIPPTLLCPDEKPTELPHAVDALYASIPENDDNHTTETSPSDIFANCDTLEPLSPLPATQYTVIDVKVDHLSSSSDIEAELFKSAAARLMPAAPVDDCACIIDGSDVFYQKLINSVPPNDRIHDLVDLI